MGTTSIKNTKLKMILVLINPKILASLAQIHTMKFLA